jgi:hypothetical protein
MSEPQKTKPQDSGLKELIKIFKALRNEIKSKENPMTNEQIVDQPLSPGSNTAPEPQSAPPQFIIKNQTARRIGINPKNGEGDQLIIPPFGSIILGKNELEDFEKIDTWVKRNLITISDELAETEDRWKTARDATPGCLIMLYILFLIISIPLAIVSKLTRVWPSIGVGTLVFILLMVIDFILLLQPKKDDASKKASQQYWQWFSLLPSLILTLAIGFGVPISIVYFFGGGSELITQTGNANLLLLGRILQLGFVSIASILPALMYFLFGRQQLEKLRNNFIREVMMLDPNIQTTSEAETKYDPLFDSVYVDRTPLNSLPIYFSTVLITFGWIMTLLPIGQTNPLESRTLVDLFTPHVTALNFGFLGAYFFSINLIFRRYVRTDITTKTYTYITIRLLVTAILTWVVSSVFGLLFGEAAAARAGILIIAFYIGIFPETGTAVLQDLYRKYFRGILKSLEEEHPLTNLEGINLYDRARLLEEGIENIENLAHHNLLDLVVKTHITTPRIVDMFDQAILYMHLGLATVDLLNKRQLLRTYGIRTATDLQQVMKNNPPEIFSFQTRLIDASKKEIQIQRRFRFK